MGHGQFITLDPWIVQCCTTHGSWENDNYQSVIQSMGYGVYTLSMTHGSYDVVWSMGHGEMIVVQRVYNP